MYYSANQTVSYGNTNQRAAPPPPSLPFWGIWTRSNSWIRLTHVHCYTVPRKIAATFDSSLSTIFLFKNYENSMKVKDQDQMYLAISTVQHDTYLRQVTSTSDK